MESFGVKWGVFVDHQGERANTLFDTEAEAWAFAELLDKQSSFDAVHVRRLLEGPDGVLFPDGLE